MFTKIDTKHLAALLAGPTPAEALLRFIAARLVSQYGESENVDFVQALRRRADEIETLRAFAGGFPRDAACATCGYPYEVHAEFFGEADGRISNCKRGYDGDPKGCGMCRDGEGCPGEHAFRPGRP